MWIVILIQIQYNCIAAIWIPVEYFLLLDILSSLFFTTAVLELLLTITLFFNST